jgi:hypothetical protein
MAARDMSQAIFSRVTGPEERKAVERLLPLAGLIDPASTESPDAMRSRVEGWLRECCAAWAGTLWAGGSGAR